MFKIKHHQALFQQIDHPRTFPHAVFDLLREHQVMVIPLAKSFKNPFVNFCKKSQDYWDVLYELGQGDLSVGRIFEGHVNALLIIETYGTVWQRSFYFDQASKGKLFGVWNTELPSENLIVTKSHQVQTLKGAKTFCSGALNVQFPIVTAKSSKGLQMLILDLEKHKELKEDWSLWDPIGMCASVSCRIDFTGVIVEDNQYLGIENDYYKEPHFSWGATRFSVVQLGAVKNIVEIVVAHLTNLQQEKDCYQKMRLGKMAILMEMADLWLAKVRDMDRNHDGLSCNEKVNFGNMMRTITHEICTEIITLAETCVGLQGMMKSHPLEKVIRDLRVYLKQGGPVLALSKVGENFAKKLIQPRIP